GWDSATGGASGRADLSKSRRVSVRGLAKGAVTYRGHLALHIQDGCAHEKLLNHVAHPRDRLAPQRRPECALGLEVFLPQPGGAQTTARLSDQGEPAGC